MILGFQGTSLVNYPKEICSVIFLSDCNFHCPYCYNKSLVFPSRDTQPLSKEYITDELKKRISFISGICITGGEPTLYHFDLIKLIEDIKSDHPKLKIKLDTNGSRPEVLKNLFEMKLIDYVAMDFKTVPNEYKDLICKFDVQDAITESIELIRNNLSKENYEFRITILRELFTIETARRMSRFLKQDENVYLQNFKFMGEGNHINIKSFHNVKTLSYTSKEIKVIAEPIIKKCNVKFRNF